MATTQTVINLYVDVQNKQLVVAANSTTAYTLPTLFENNEITFNVVFLLPTGQLNSFTPYTVLNMNGVPFRMSIGAQPLGNGSVTPAAINTVWTWVAAGTGPATAPPGVGYYTGTLNLNTVAMDNLIGANSSFTGTLELNLVNSDQSYSTILQISATVKAVLDSTNTTVPTPAATYFTAAESNAKFVQYVGLPGATITLVSPSGTWKRIIGIDDSGNPIDDQTNS